MTTLENRPNTACLVIDLQNDVVRGNHEIDSVIANVATLVDRARWEEVPVVWVEHSVDGAIRDSESWKIVFDLGPLTAEHLVEKYYGNSFEGTDLEAARLANSESGDW